MQRRRANTLACRISSEVDGSRPDNLLKELALQTVGIEDSSTVRGYLYSSANLVQLRGGFEHRDLMALTREAYGSTQAGDAGANDQNIEGDSLLARHV